MPAFTDQFAPLVAAYQTRPAMVEAEHAPQRPSPSLAFQAAKVDLVLAATAEPLGVAVAAAFVQPDDRRRHDQEDDNEAREQRQQIHLPSIMRQGGDRIDAASLRVGPSRPAASPLGIAAVKIVVGDIGGTHARFALAELREGERPRLGSMKKYRSREHEGLPSAWEKFARDSGEALPREASLAVAAPIEGETLTFMNNPWRIPRFEIAGTLGLERLALLNDFGAVAHAVSVMGPDELEPVAGPPGLPPEGVISVIGPGTGLGVAILSRQRGRITVIETESAHIAFAPLDPEEEALADALVARYGRASVERVVSGPGLIDIYHFLGGSDEHDANLAGELWSAAIEGQDALAVHALDILVRCFGAAAGDISLAHGAMGVAITGGLANRIVHLLRSPMFEARFTAKGRYRDRMQRVAVMVSTYPEPGLLGAAVAFEREHLEREGRG